MMGMAEYIEREALMRRIKEIHCAECDSYHGVKCRACWVDDTLDYIDCEPAADVAPVRHGRWERDEWGSYLRRCSVCKKSPVYKDERGIGVAVYAGVCINCGAKMDGGND